MPPKKWAEGSNSEWMAEGAVFGAEMRESKVVLRGHTVVAQFQDFLTVKEARMLACQLEEASDRIESINKENDDPS